MAKTHRLLTSPLSSTVVTKRTYTADQAAQITALREYVETLLLPASDPYLVWELRWVNLPDTMARYMRAAKWRFEEAKTRIHNTLLWRREYQPDLIPPEEVRIESESGKIILNGFDFDGRPILYMRPGRENTATSPRQLRHLVFCLERARDMLPENQESVVILVDYRSTTLRTNPSIGTARKVLTILQQHYVETLGRAIVVNLPTLLSFFYKGISPFLDPITREKMKFNPDLSELIPAEHLDADFGGKYEYEFEPVSYWTQIIERCGITSDGRRSWSAERKESEASAIAVSATQLSNESSLATTPTSRMTNDAGTESSRSSVQEPNSDYDAKTAGVPV